MEIRNQSPIILRRRLRVILRGLRDGKGFSQAEVAQALDWAPSKLRRIESGASRISVIDLRALLNHYDLAVSSQVDDLIQMARYARRQLYGGYGDILSQDFLTYLQYEGAASIIRSFEPNLVPGLLQTEDYAAALLALNPVTTDSEQVIARRVQARLERQEALTGVGSPKAFFILDEAVLHRHVGGAGAMGRQLRWLLEVGGLGNVEIRIIPYERGEHLGLWGSFVVLEFADIEDDDLAFVEYQLGDRIIDGGAAQAEPYVERFWNLEARSASIEESRRLIDQAMRSMT